MLFKALKTLILYAILAAQICAPSAQAAGTTPLALVPQVDSSGNAASGCLLYFFQAGTVATPQNAFSDFGLTQTLPNPVSCDQSGRVPMHWLADGLIHIRLTDSLGVVLVDTTMQTLGPSSGGGGGGGPTVDPTSIMATGDEKIRYGTGAIAGWVRENGLTIGNATSGATERANADTQNLFVYLYTTDPNLVVSGGRTGNALNDYNGNKTITTPDMRGRVNGFLADMGNTATSVLTTTYAGCASVTTLGIACGSQSHTQLATEIAAHQHSVFLHDPGHVHPNIPIAAGAGGNGGVLNSVSGTTNSGSATTGMTIGSVNGVANDNQTALFGSATPFTIVPPIMLKTAYIKL